MKISTATTLLSTSLLLNLPAAAQPTAPADPLQIARSVIAGFRSGDVDGVFELFDDAMKAGVPKEKLELILKQLGPLRSCGEPTSMAEGNATLLRSACTFANAALDLKLTIRAEKVAGMWFVPPDSPYSAPSYVNASAFHDTDVTVGAGEWALPATLSLPNGAGPFPAIVLVHGSGPQDRDETVGPNRPFKDLAWGLASRGIAVLRYEKRTKQHGARLGALTSFTVNEETVDDAVLAVKLLKGTAGIDPARVFVLGHSLGGMLAPRIGKAAMARPETSIAGLVILAGNTRPLQVLLVEQLDYLGGLEGASKEGHAELRKEANKVKYVTPTTEGLMMGAPAAYWMDLRSYLPGEVAKSLPVPLLILHGDRDYQVTRKDLDGWRTALAERSDVVFRTYPRLNHLFVEGDGKSTPSEYEKPGHVATAVLDDVETFVKRKPGAGQTP